MVQATLGSSGDFILTPVFAFLMGIKSFVLMALTHSQFLGREREPLEPRVGPHVLSLMSE